MPYFIFIVLWSPHVGSTKVKGEGDVFLTSSNDDMNRIAIANTNGTRVCQIYK